MENLLAFGCLVLTLVLYWLAKKLYRRTGNWWTAPLLAVPLLVIGAVVCEGLFILLNKRLRTPVPPLALSTLMSMFGLLTALLPALWEAPWQLHASAQATHALAAIAYYAIVPTVGGFVLWYAGAARVSGAEAALFTALAPVAAVAFAAVLLGEVVSVRQISGITCVLAAVLSLALARSSAPTSSRPKEST